MINNIYYYVFSSNLLYYFHFNVNLEPPLINVFIILSLQVRIACCTRNATGVFSLAYAVLLAIVPPFLLFVNIYNCLCI